MPPVLPGILKKTFKWLAGLLAVLVIAVLLLLWRLSSSPLQLNQLVPRIEQAASGLPGGLSVRLQGIELYWNRAGHYVDLRATSVDLVDVSGVSLASVPEVEITLSGRALLRGEFALSSIELRDFDVQLVRSEDGSFRVFKKSDANAQQGSQDRAWDQAAFFQHLFKVLASDANPEYPLSYLKKLKISGAVQVDDRKNGFKWSANEVDSLFTSSGGEVKGRIGVTFSSPAAIGGIHSDIALTLRDDTVTARADFSGLKPAGIATLDQRLAVLKGLDVSLDGRIDTSLTLPGDIQHLEASLASTSGQFTHPEYFPRPLRIDALKLGINTDLPGRLLNVTDLDIRLGDAAKPLQLKLNGAVHMAANSVGIQLSANVQDLEVSKLDDFWPRKVALGARKWLVKNLRAGTVDKADLDLAMQVPVGADAAFRLDELKGKVGFSALTVTYFGDLPPAAGVAGGGSFDRHGFDLDIQAGQVNGVSVGPGKVLISGLDDGQAAISIDTHLAGPVVGVFGTLASPPLELGARALGGHVSERLGGRLEADFSIGLPLKSGLRAVDIDYRASGAITGGEFRKIFHDFDLGGAAVDFSLDPAQVKMKGPLAFAGIPLTVDWTTHLAGPAKGRSEFTVDAAAIGGDQVDSLGLEVSDYLQGSFKLNSTGELAPGGRLTADIGLDMQQTALAVPVIQWTKNTGEAGKVNFRLAAEKDWLQVSDIKVDLGKVSTSGSAGFKLAGPGLSASFEQVSTPVARLDGLKLDRGGNGILAITLKGGEASLEHFLSGGDAESRAGEIKSPPARPASAPHPGAWWTNLEIHPSRLDKVSVKQDAWFDQVDFSARRDEKGWQSLKISGHDPSAEDAGDDGVMSSARAGELGPGQFSLGYGPAENGRYPVHVEVENLGSMISSVAGKNVMNGGYLVLDGESRGPLMTSPVKTTIEMDNFTIKHAPGIVSVLNMASLTQIVSSLTQTGLAFRSASGDLQLDGAIFSSQRIKMTGGSLGLFVGGRVDAKHWQVDVGGTVVPLHKINEIVGKVPLIGQVVAGKDGQGIMAVDYKLKGPISKPEVSISKTPLTKGILNILDEAAEDVDRDGR